jgi:uncharacterized integral membrane protein
MLSRTVGIRRTAGEDRETRAHASVVNPTRSGADGRAWGSWVPFLILAASLAVFAFRNRAAVVEPRLDFLFAGIDRPSLLAVLLLTSVVSAAAVLLARAAVHDFRQRRDARDRRVAKPVQPPPLAAMTAVAPSAARAP